MSKRKSRDSRTARASHGEPKNAVRRAGSARPAILFILRFGLAWLLAVIGMTFVPQVERLAIHGTVWNLALLLQPFPVRVDTSGSYITAGPVSFEIVEECTPLLPAALLWSAIIAFPTPWRAKLWGLLLGAAAVWVYNLIRILAMFAVARWWPAAHDFAHVYLWQTTTLLVVFGLFLTWLRYSNRESPAALARDTVS